VNKEEGGEVVDASVYFLAGTAVSCLVGTAVSGLVGTAVSGLAGTAVSDLVGTAVACPLAGTAVVTSGWRGCGGEATVDGWATFPEKGHILSAEREMWDTTFGVFKRLCGCVCCVWCCCVVS
jgi:hypothetical protein